MNPASPAASGRVHSGESPSLLVLFHEPPRRWGYRALGGALERLPAVAVDLTRSPEKAAARAAAFSGEALLVCFSFFSEETERVAQELAAYRATLPGAVFAAGGPHSSGDPAGVLAMGFDLVVRGEGELAILDIAGRLLAGSRDFAHIPGVWTLRGGEVAGERPGPRVELDDFPPISLKHRLYGPLEITRGCPYACRYCQTPQLFGTQVRHRGVALIAATARAMRERGMTYLRFVTPDAFAYGSPDGRQMAPDAVAALLSACREAMGPRGQGGHVFLGSFPSEVRPEHCTTEMLRLVATHCDNDNIVLGAQSGSEDVLRRLRRGHGVDAVYAAVDTVLSAGFIANVDVMLGLPGESVDEQHETVRLMRVLAAQGARVHAHAFMPLPGTPFARENPAPIDASVRREMRRLESSGGLFGHWKRQEQAARRMTARDDAS